MADGGGGAGRRRNKNQEMAKDLIKRGMPHGYRSWPWNQGINWPSLNDVGSAANRRRQKKTSRG